MKELIIQTGNIGSGKSTLAKNIKKKDTLSLPGTN
jgi:predicted kinase